MKGQLFTQYFLTDGIRTTPEWEGAVTKLADFRRDLGQAYERFSSLHQPNEAVTEQDLIRPVLGLLGWTDYLPQQAAAGHEDVPDHLLFADAASKARATARGNSDDRFQDALVVQESKRFGLALDQRDRTDGPRVAPPLRCRARPRPPSSRPPSRKDAATRNRWHRTCPAWCSNACSRDW